MVQELSISIGQYSDKGRKEINQDFHGALIPVGHVLSMKGIAIALADGISSSSVSQIAAENAVKSFMIDYYCTSDTWSVETSAERVINASNSWLYSETKRSQHAYDMDRGYVCTLSAIVLKAQNAHLFHIGDSRIYRISGGSMEQLTQDHRLVVSSEQSFLSRAVGMAQDVEIQYRKLAVSVGDVFVLMTDGVYEYTDAGFVTGCCERNPDDLDSAARLIAEDALDRGSSDNLTIQIVRVDTLPDGDAFDYVETGINLPAPPLMESGQTLDNYKILRELHANSRSHIYLVADQNTGAQLALKIPSIDLREDPDYLKRFMMEEWIARRINNGHVLSAPPHVGKRNYLYVVTEYLEGRTLAQWIIDNPRPDIELVRSIVAQIIKGIRAIHRREMVHQDLRPENIMIDDAGTIKIIDFGSTKVAGVMEAGPEFAGEQMLGTLQYAAPEYFSGELGTRRSDFFSLGIIVYQMLTGKLPYGPHVSNARTKAQQRKLRYISARTYNEDVPNWMDGALNKMLHVDPFKRYETLSEFFADLRSPNKSFADNRNLPLVKKNPVAVWQGISLILGLFILYLLFKTSG